MSKQASTTGKGLSASKRAAKAPSAPVVTPAAAPVAATPAAPKAVALRGGPAVQAVKLTGKVYRVGASHNAGWWQQVATAAAGDKAVPVADLLAAGVPAPFIGYTIRRGYLQVA